MARRLKEEGEEPIDEGGGNTAATSLLNATSADERTEAHPNYGDIAAVTRALGLGLSAMLGAELQTAFEAAVWAGKEDDALKLLEQSASWCRTMRICGEQLSLLGAAARLDRGDVVKVIVQRMRADGVDAEAMAECLEAAAYHASVSAALNPRRALVQEGLAVRSTRIWEED